MANHENTMRDNVEQCKAMPLLEIHFAQTWITALYGKNLTPMTLASLSAAAPDCAATHLCIFGMCRISTMPYAPTQWAHSLPSQADLGQVRIRNGTIKGGEWKLPQFDPKWIRIASGFVSSECVRMLKRHPEGTLSRLRARQPPP
jgi:hypothetical protein